MSFRIYVHGDSSGDVHPCGSAASRSSTENNTNTESNGARVREYYVVRGTRPVVDRVQRSKSALSSHIRFNVPARDIHIQMHAFLHLKLHLYGQVQYVTMRSVR